MLSSASLINVSPSSASSINESPINGSPTNNVDTNITFTVQKVITTIGRPTGKASLVKYSTPKKRNNHKDDINIQQTNKKKKLEIIKETEPIILSDNDSTIYANIFDTAMNLNENEWFFDDHIYCYLQLLREQFPNIFLVIIK